jgi:serine/threonine protein kinase
VAVGVGMMEHSWTQEDALAATLIVEGSEGSRQAGLPSTSRGPRGPRRAQDPTPRPRAVSASLAAEAPTSAEQEVLVGRYLVLRRLGAGGCGDVDLALDRSILGRRVAIKRLPRHLLADPRARKRFAREARMAARAHHPGVVSVYDFDHDEHARPFLVMEYVPGVTLATHARHRLGVHEAASLALDLAGAVEALHEVGVVHRDVKPSNVMVFEQWGQLRTKLVDFGLACALDAPAEAEEDATCGTPQYMAPEQILGAAADTRADIFAFGCVVFELLTGHPPAGSDSRHRVLTRQLYTTPPPVSAFGAQVSLSLENALARALAKEPEHRPTTLTELKAALHETACRAVVELDYRR